MVSMRFIKIGHNVPQPCVSCRLRSIKLSAKINKMRKLKLEHSVLTAITQDCCYRLWFFFCDCKPFHIFILLMFEIADISFVARI
jgi:hypothetical protein